MNRPKNIKICTVCGKPFECPPSDKTVTCSKPCSKIHRSRTHTGKKFKWGEEAKKRFASRNYMPPPGVGTAAAMRSPKAGHFETNVNAKEWHLISPEGKHYQCRNLNLWAENHYDLFGFDSISDAYKISAGIRQIKRAMQNKIKNVKNPTTTYKGWRIVLVEEE